MTRSATAVGPANVLGPTGLGVLTIGMTRKAAEATGMVRGFDGDRCGRWSLTGGPVDGSEVVWSTVRGVVLIPAYGRIADPKGIRIGSTLAQVQQAHPDFTRHDIGGGFHGDGTVYAGTTDGYADVHYRFELRDGEVTSLSLEHDRQDCYERPGPAAGDRRRVASTSSVRSTPAG